MKNKKAELQETLIYVWVKNVVKVGNVIRNTRVGLCSIACFGFEHLRFERMNSSANPLH